MPSSPSLRRTRRTTVQLVLVAAAALLATALPLDAAGSTTTGASSLAGTTTARAAAFADPDPAADPAAAEVVRELAGPVLLAAQRAAGLSCSTSSRGLAVCAHGEDSRPAAQDDADADDAKVLAESTGGTSSGSAPAGGLGCYGTGTDGRRIRAVYARPAGSANRYAETAPRIRSWAAALDGQFDRSAQRSGGRRHLRFATTAGSACRLVVLDVVLPAAAFLDLPATINALEARGLHVPQSKYLVWADSETLCGIATTYADDRPGADNPNNGAELSYARVDRPCWGRVEAHELIHMLGGVQRSAPHSTHGMHCNDGADLMCYDDRTPRSTQRSVCGESTLLDCRNDDYFSVSPPQGSYLALHWNTARSAYFAPTLRDPARSAPPKQASPGPTPSPGPSTSSRPSASPAPTAGPSSTASPKPAGSPSPTPGPSTGPGPLPDLPDLPDLPVVPALPVAPALTVAPALPARPGPGAQQ